MKLLVRALTKLICGMAAIGLLLFLPAGTLNYPNGLLFCGLLFIPMIVVGAILFAKDKSLLEKRLNSKENEGAQKLVDNGCIAVFEGANMPLTPEAIELVKANGLLYSPGKASNAGGVATSGLEMSQNSIRMSWSFDEVDEKLHGIMQEIYKACYDASVECGKPGDLMVGANVAGFLKVADAMMAQGIV